MPSDARVADCPSRQGLDRHSTDRHRKDHRLPTSCIHPYRGSDNVSSWPTSSIYCSTIRGGGQGLDRHSTDRHRKDHRLPTSCIHPYRGSDNVSSWPTSSIYCSTIRGGKDLIGIAQTGTGKTIAFLLPAFIHIEGQTT